MNGVASALADVPDVHRGPFVFDDVLDVLVIRCCRCDRVVWRDGA